MSQNAKGSRRERELLKILEGQGFVVHRVAGSGVGEKAICDLVAVKEGKVFFYECKSRKKYYYPKEDKEQLAALIDSTKKAGATAVLAVKLNNKDWKFLELGDEVPEKINW